MIQTCSSTSSALKAHTQRKKRRKKPSESRPLRMTANTTCACTQRMHEITHTHTASPHSHTLRRTLRCRTHSVPSHRDTTLAARGLGATNASSPAHVCVCVCVTNPHLYPPHSPCKRCVRKGTQRHIVGSDSLHQHTARVCACVTRQIRSVPRGPATNTRKRESAPASLHARSNNAGVVLFLMACTQQQCRRSAYVATMQV